jgi:hypothetical protein
MGHVLPRAVTRCGAGLHELMHSSFRSTLRDGDMETNRVARCGGARLPILCNDASHPLEIDRHTRRLVAAAWARSRSGRCAPSLSPTLGAHGLA